MNQADRDAEKWLEQHQKYQRYELIKAKELSTPHYINQHGEVIHDTNKKLIPK